MNGLAPDPKQVKDDPKVPLKMYAAIVSAFLTSIIADAALDLPPLAVAIITGLISALAVFSTPNPKIRR